MGASSSTVTLLHQPGREEGDWNGYNSSATEGNQFPSPLRDSFDSSINGLNQPHDLHPSEARDASGRVIEGRRRRSSQRNPFEVDREPEIPEQIGHMHQLRTSWMPVEEGVQIYRRPSGDLERESVADAGASAWQAQHWPLEERRPSIKATRIRGSQLSFEDSRD